MGIERNETDWLTYRQTWFVPFLVSPSKRCSDHARSTHPALYPSSHVSFLSKIDPSKIPREIKSDHELNNIFSDKILSCHCVLQRIAQVYSRLELRPCPNRRTFPFSTHVIVEYWITRYGTLMGTFALTASVLLPLLSIILTATFCLQKMNIDHAKLSQN